MVKHALSCYEEARLESLRGPRGVAPDEWWHADLRLLDDGYSSEDTDSDLEGLEDIFLVTSDEDNNGEDYAWVRLSSWLASTFGTLPNGREPHQFSAS